MRAPLRTKPTGSADPGSLAQLARPGGKLAPRRTPGHPLGEWPDTTARSLAHPPADTGRPEPSEATQDVTGPESPQAAHHWRWPGRSASGAATDALPVAAFWIRRVQGPAHFRAGQVTPQSSRWQARRGQEQTPAPQHTRSLDFVPRAGLEPARPFEQSILSAPCLPFHHPGGLRRSAYRDAGPKKYARQPRQANSQSRSS